MRRVLSASPSCILSPTLPPFSKYWRMYTHVCFIIASSNNPYTSPPSLRLLFEWCVTPWLPISTNLSTVASCIHRSCCNWRHSCWTTPSIPCLQCMERTICFGYYVARFWDSWDLDQYPCLVYHTDLSGDEVSILCSTINALFKYLENKQELFFRSNKLIDSVECCVSWVHTSLSSAGVEIRLQGSTGSNDHGHGLIFFGV